MFKLRTLEDVCDLVRGASILGTGGGGSPKAGINLLKQVLEESKDIVIIDVEELPNDAILVSPYYLGTIAPKRLSKKIIIQDPIMVAIKEMEKYLGRSIDALIPCELGGFNTSVALYVGAKLGIPVVDGDLVGRAAPEIHQSTLNIYNIPMTPAILVSKTGNTVIVKNYASLDDYERIARNLAVLSGGSIAVVDTPITKNVACKVIIKGTLTKCMKLGKVVREALKKNENPIDYIVRELSGWKIFEGIIKSCNLESRSDFLIGEVVLEGVGEWKGHIFRSWIKNEHIIAWRDNRIIVMPPDLIIFLKDNGEAIMNSELREGDRVQIVATKAPQIWRSRKGLELFGPRHFGFNMDYIPVEKLIERF